jgi:hypothetical protein
MPSVVLIIFNRPDLVELQCERLRDINIDQLLVIADGPRPGTDDAGKCAAARSIIDATDWHCDVRKNYADENMGCANRIVSGLDWVFSIVDRAIILEDDCLAHPGFIRFCDELLERYADDEQVMQICGTNPLTDIQDPCSYRFSHHIMCWGWATWARAWVCNDVSMNLPEEDIDTLLERYMQGNQTAIEHWRMVIGKTRRGELDAWDYPWQLSIWRHGGIAVLPNQNLVMNAGFRVDATHTKNSKARLANLPLQELTFPIKHPPDTSYGFQYDIQFIEQGPGRVRTAPAPARVGLVRRVVSKLRRILAG